MKIRYGFVSNSSTTSFCIYGAYIDEVDVINKCEELGLIEDSYGGPDELSEKMGLEMYSSDYSICFGKSWSLIGLDETGRQFQESVSSKILEYFPNAHFDTIEDTFNN